MITVALPKGRTLQATLDRFGRAGLVPEDDFASTLNLRLTGEPLARRKPLRAQPRALRLS